VPNSMRFVRESLNVLVRVSPKTNKEAPMTYERGLSLEGSLPANRQNGSDRGNRSC
jgi:hypothetical protein